MAVQLWEALQLDPPAVSHIPRERGEAAPRLGIPERGEAGHPHRAPPRRFSPSFLSPSWSPFLSALSLCPLPPVLALSLKTITSPQRIFFVLQLDHQAEDVAASRLKNK